LLGQFGGAELIAPGMLRMIQFRECPHIDRRCQGAPVAGKQNHAVCSPFNRCATSQIYSIGVVISSRIGTAHQESLKPYFSVEAWRPAGSGHLGSAETLLARVFVVFCCDVGRTTDIAAQL
jgi:hypothetical protein